MKVGAHLVGASLQCSVGLGGAGIADEPDGWTLTLTGLDSGSVERISSHELRFR